MKHWIRITVLLLALAILSGCTLPFDHNHNENNQKTASTEATTQPASAADSAGYSAVDKDILQLLKSGSTEGNYTYITIGMKEVVAPIKSVTDRYSSISYALEDINDDSNPEMIVLDSMDNTRILAVFTLKNDAPTLIDEGWNRSRLYRLSDGSRYSEGSGGAAYSTFSFDAELWFTYPKNSDQTEIGFYYSADGTYDPAAAQEITTEEYHAKKTELTKKISPFSVYHFS